MQLAERVAIVTGAAQGIGRATALALAREGADILLVDLDLDRAEQVAAEIRILGRSAEVFKADVAASAEVEAMVQRCLERFGRIDILVNNAGILSRTTGLDVTESEWDTVLSINLKGPFLCSKAAIPTMLKQGRGRIVNVSSIAGLEGSGPGDIPYAASKAGLLGLTKTFAKLVGRSGINVNAVAPWLVGTEMTLRAGRRTRDVLEEVGRGSYIGRVAQPEEIAEVIVFLASDAASYLSGEVIPLTGGGPMRAR